MPYSGILGKSASSLDKFVLGEANDAAAVVLATPGLVILFKNDDGIVTPLKEEFGRDGTLYIDGDTPYVPIPGQTPIYDLTGQGIGPVQYGLVDGISDTALQTPPAVRDSFKYLLPTSKYYIAVDFANGPDHNVGEDGDYLLGSAQPTIIWYQLYKYGGRWRGVGNLNAYPLNPHPYIPDPDDNTNYNLPTVVTIVLEGSGEPDNSVSDQNGTGINGLGVESYIQYLYVNTDTHELWQQEILGPSDNYHWVLRQYSIQTPHSDTSSQVTIKTTTPVAINGTGTMELWFRPFEFGTERYVDDNYPDVIIEREYYDIMRLRQGDQSIALRTSIANPNHIKQFTINYNYLRNDGTYSAGDDISEFFFHGLESDSTSYVIPTIDIGLWYHLVLAWDQTRVTAYINGTVAWDSLSDSPSYPVPIVGETTDFGGTIGEINGWTLDWGTSSGQYDLVAVYDRKLTDGDVTRHFTAAAQPRTPSSLRVSSIFSPFAATYEREARMSKMLNETIYSTVRSARISKQYIETLRSVEFDDAIHRNVQQRLVYTTTTVGEVRVPIVKLVEQTLALNDYGTGIENPLDPDLDQTLNFTQTTAWVRSKHVQQTLTFTQTVTYNAVFHRSPVQVLTLSQPYSIQKTLNLFATNTLDFTQNGDRGSVEQILTYIQTLDGYVSHDTTDLLTFTQTVGLMKNQRERSILQPLIYSEMAWINGPNAYTIPSDILSDAGLGDIDLGITDDYGYNTSFLEFEETVALDRVRGQSKTDNLVFTQTATIVKVFHRSLTQTLQFIDGNISQDLGMIVNGQPVIYTFAVAQATLIRHGRKIVTYQSKQGVITLPAPEWGDTEDLGNEVKIKRSMSGKVYSYIKTARWMKLKYDFTITRKKAFELRSFLQENLTEVITLKNWKGQIFVGQFLVNPIQLTSAGRYANSYEKITVTLEFEGVRVHG